MLFANHQRTQDLPSELADLHRLQFLSIQSNFLTSLPAVLPTMFAEGALQAVLVRVAFSPSCLLCCFVVGAACSAFFAVVSSCVLRALA
jgi:hypothetical protein